MVDAMRKLSAVVFWVAAILTPSGADGQDVNQANENEMRECIQGRWRGRSYTETFGPGGVYVLDNRRGQQTALWMYSQMSGLAVLTDNSHIRYAVECSERTLTFREIEPRYGEVQTQQRVDVPEFRRRLAEHRAEQARRAAAYAERRAQEEAQAQADREHQERLRILRGDSEAANSRRALAIRAWLMVAEIPGQMTVSSMPLSTFDPARSIAFYELAALRTYSGPSRGRPASSRVLQGRDCHGVWWLTDETDGVALHVRTVDACGVQGDWMVPERNPEQRDGDRLAPATMSLHPLGQATPIVLTMFPGS